MAQNKAIETDTLQSRRSKAEANKKLQTMQNNDGEGEIDNEDVLNVVKENISDENLNLARQYKREVDHCVRMLVRINNRAENKDDKG